MWLMLPAPHTTRQRVEKPRSAGADGGWHGRHVGLARQAAMVSPSEFRVFSRNLSSHKRRLATTRFTRSWESR